MHSKAEGNDIDIDNKSRVTEAGKRIFSLGFRKSGFEIEYIKGSESLLTVMEQIGMKPEYHCRSGFCGTCRCLLISGKVIYFSTPLAYFNDGEILPCCCYPASDLIIDL